MLVALQPAGSPASHQHYVDTIENPVPIDRCEAFLGPDELSALLSTYTDGLIPLWGVTPGRTGLNVGKYERLNLGDYVLFSRDKEVFWGGRIEALFQNEPLARDLWGENDHGQTWELMYALSSGRDLALPVPELNALVGYAEGNVVQGFQVLDQTKSDALIEALGLLNPLAEMQTEEQAFKEALKPPPTDPSDDLFEDADGWARSTRRKAQPYIRDQLIPGETGTCDLCGISYGKPFLRAAHVKPWRVLSLKEKADFRNSAMVACVFGCDELYERGYVTVAGDGSIEVSPNVNPSSGEAQYVQDHLLDRTCTAWTEESEEYFAWHRENRGL